MKQLEIPDVDATRMAILLEVRRSPESRYDHRLHGLLLVASGLSCTAVAETFGESPRTVQRWIRAFQRHGLDALREGARPGRPPLLNAQTWSSLVTDVQRSPAAFGQKRGPWDGKTLAVHLEKYYQVVLGVRQCQRLLRRIGAQQRTLDVVSGLPPVDN